MVIDTSAILAILFNESDAAYYSEQISQDPKRLISAGTLLELMIVIEAKKGEAGSRELDLLLHRIKVDVVAFDGDQADLARIAWRKFGKGNHPAGLNFGDCFAYALAQTSGERLLFKGQDFIQTDIGKSAF